MKKLFVVIFMNMLLADAFEGLTLITNSGNNDVFYEQSSLTILIDNDENIINSWSHNTRVSSIAYLMPDSVLFVPCKKTDQDGGPMGGRYKKMNWDGDILWDYYLPDDICIPHHDIVILPNGNILSICSETKSQEQALEVGLVLSGSIVLDMVIEIKPVGTNNAEIVWEWHFWDHLIQDHDTNLLNYGIVSEHPELLDMYVNGTGNDEGIQDWIHTNCISYNSMLDQIVLSTRRMSEFYVIDHSTTTSEAASHTGGNSNMGGDLLYRWGNPQNYGRGDQSSQILDSQHGVNWIEDGYLGGGNFILYNNFHSNDNSAVLEIEPPIGPDGIYIINDEEPYGPVSYSWMYQSDFFSNKQSGAFRLPNGNTLITSDQDSRLFEVDFDGNIQWEYQGSLNTARAIKYSFDYFNSSIVGDLNNDDLVNVLDVIVLVNHILSPAAVELDGADINNDDNVNVLDIVQLVGIILGSN